MPNWKKLIVSGSDANLNSLFVSNAITSSAISASSGITGSLFGTSSWATDVLTASYVNTLNQNVLITGSLTVGATSLGIAENTLTLGPRSTNEGGQLLLQAGTSYTSASMLDVYQDVTPNIPYLRILRGSNAGSDAVVTQWNMHTKQLSLPAYNSPTAFVGTTLIGLLGFDANGNILTTTTGSGGGGGISGGVVNYLAKWNSSTTLTTGSVFDSGSNVGIGTTTPTYKLDVSGDIRSTGAVYANANGTMYFRGGDDAELWDINVANTIGIYGQQNQDRAAIKLGNAGPTLFGSSSRLGIGTITPTLGTLEVNGNVYATSFTGSLQGTASWANNAVSSSYPITLNDTSIISAYPAGGSGGSNNNSIYLGDIAGGNATNANNSNFFGQQAGADANEANNSNFIGGYRPGFQAWSASYSNFLGSQAGSQARNANNSNFFGLSAGFQATNAKYSNFIGSNAGVSATSASYSTLIGYQVGYNVAGGALGIKSNNIIIGTNITLPDGTQNAINLGGVLFGTGTYSNIFSNPSSGSANGKIGINIVSPNYTLDVNGSGNFSNGLTVTGSLNAPNITGSLLGTASYVTGAIHTSTNPALSSSYALSASYALNSTSASFATSSSFATTASFASNFIVPSIYITTGSNTSTQSISGSLNISGSTTIIGTLTATTIVAQTITASTEWVTGSSKFGNVLTDTHQFTGSVSISGSLNATASFSINALTASSANDFVVRNDLYVYGNTTLGDATTDSISFTAATMSIGGGDGILNIDSNTLYVDGFNDRVGIGTSTPNSKLDINNGGINVSINNNTPGLRVTASNAGFTNIEIINLSTSTGAGSALRFANNVGSTGNPQAQIFLGSSNYTSGNHRLFIQSITGSVEITSTSGNVDINTSAIGIANTKLRVFNNGNVAIGTNPSDNGYKLDINGPGTSGALRASGSSVMTGSLNVSQGITGSLFGTSSWATNAITASFLPIGTYNITSSWATNARTASFTPNALVTASVSSNTITFTKGDGSTFPIAVTGGGMNFAPSWTTYTPTIRATGSATFVNPTGSSTAVSSALYSIIDNGTEGIMFLKWSFAQTTAGTEGSGSYIFAMPPGYKVGSVVTTLAETNSSSYWAANTPLGIASLYGGGTGTSAVLGTGVVVAYNSDYLAIVANTVGAGANSAGPQLVSHTNIKLGTACSIKFTAEIPYARA